MKKIAGNNLRKSENVRRLPQDALKTRKNSNLKNRDNLNGERIFVNVLFSTKIGDFAILRNWETQAK